MKFAKIYGKIDEKSIQKAEDRLSSVFLELGASYGNEFFGTKMGGDPLIFSLLAPIEHHATLGISTAATDGIRYYWNPNFVNKLSKIGLRIVCAHEALHAQFMHPQRRMDRHPKLWNICVDFMVHDFVMEDFTVRKFNPADLFQKNLGGFITVKEYAEFLKNPFIDKNGEIARAEKDANASAARAPKITENRELLDPEKRILDAKEKRSSRFFADPQIDKDLKSPDKLYEYFYSILPKCPKCGKLGVYSKDKNDQQKQQGKGKKGKDQGKEGDKGKDKGDGQGKDPSEQEGQDPGQGQGQQGQNGQENGDQDSDGGGGDSSDNKGCNHGSDVFDIFDTLDDHIDSQETEANLAKRLADAIDNAKRMAGHVPSGLEDELGKLVKPKVVWQDIIRSRISRTREGNKRNDWTRFRSRPISYGMFIPKRRSNAVSFGLLLDTSGSMGIDDMAFGVSQVQSLDEGSEGYVVPCDAEVYWDKATKLSSVSPEEISKVKVHGRGGTVLGSFFDDYREKIGEQDFIIVVTDGYLMDQDLNTMKDPGVPVFWLITSFEQNHMKFPFGKVYNLKNS